MEKYFEILKARIMQEQPDFGDGESVLTLLYEAYSEVNRMDDAQIKADFNELYRLMNGMELREIAPIFKDADEWPAQPITEEETDQLKVLLGKVCSVGDSNA